MQCKAYHSAPSAQTHTLTRGRRVTAGAGDLHSLWGLLPSSVPSPLALPRLHFPRPHLERGPAAGAVAALQALEELGVASLVGVDVEAQVLVGQEAGTADAAQEGPQEGFG